MENFSYSQLPEGGNYLPKPLYASFQYPNQPCHGFVTSGEIVEYRKNDSKSRRQAEKQRRDRIGAHLTTLGKLISNSDKMDKAALLGSAVEHIKDLKRKALEASHLITVPSDFDEVTIECYIDKELTSINRTVNEENIFIKASLCCEDRPELLEELSQGLKGLQMTIVRADMACLGGRYKSTLVFSFNESEEGVCITSAIHSLKGVLRKISSYPSGSNCNNRSKRQRLLFSSY